MKTKKKHPRPRLDSGTVLGLLIAMGALYAAVTMQGGQPQDLLQASAAILLLFGTLGVVLITTPLPVLREALSSLRLLWVHSPTDTSGNFVLLQSLARKARRQGLAALETEEQAMATPLFRRAIRLAADGLAAEEVRNAMQAEIRLTARKFDRHARVFEQAGGYAPTLGILGAVLGLIQVMKHLNEMAAVGQGIAEAFVSTVYGLVLANLILLPIAGRLRACAAHWFEDQELILDGMALIADRVHPLLVETRLASYVEARGGVVPEEYPRPQKVNLARGA